MELQKAESAITHLLNHIEENESFENPTELSGIMARLAYYNHVIGRHLSSLQAAYRRRRAEVYNEVMQDPKAKVTHAKQKAEEAGQDLEQQYDHYTNVHNDTDKFITVCQSHLKIKANEARGNM